MTKRAPEHRKHGFPKHSCCLQLDWLDWSDPFGGTNFLSGLNKAFEMIDRSVQEGALPTATLLGPPGRISIPQRNGLKSWYYEYPIVQRRAIG